MARIAEVSRKTGETDIAVKLDLDGLGVCDISTGVPFFDHMLNAFGRHGLFDLTVHAQGDVEVDAHHTVEDVGIVLLAIRRASRVLPTSPFPWTKRSSWPRLIFRVVARHIAICLSPRRA